MIRYLFFCSSLMLVGCMSLTPWWTDPGDGGMSIEVHLQDRHRCSRISPEIVVQNVPAGTEKFVVRLEEASTPPRYLGGGTWKYDKSGIIPEGALIEHYQGACPPAGTTGRYIYIVGALDADEQPLGVRTYKFTQE